MLLLVAGVKFAYIVSHTLLMCNSDNY